MGQPSSFFSVLLLCSLLLGSSLAQITFVKRTNGIDTSSSPAPVLVPGDSITWTYTITNSGASDLSNIVLVDNQEGPISCPSTTLVVGSSFVCSALNEAGYADYVNVATVSAANADGVVTRSASSSYQVVSPGSASIVKKTNGVDTFVSKVPRVRAGSVVTWTYEVTNNGEFDLTSVTVTDDKVDAANILCPDVPVLSPTSSFICSATGVAAKCGYTNVGCVKTVPPLASRTCHGSGYNGIHPGLSLTKYTNNLNSERAHDETHPPCLQSGCEVVWTYVVSNVGDDVLTNVYVYDDGLKRNAWCPTNKLSPWQSITCVSKPPETEEGAGEGHNGHGHKEGEYPAATPAPPAPKDVAITGLYSNVATAHGSAVVGGDELTAVDTNWYMGVQPGLRLTVTVNDVVATGGAGSYNGQCPLVPKPNPCKNCPDHQPEEPQHPEHPGDGEGEGEDDEEHEHDSSKGEGKSSGKGEGKSSKHRHSPRPQKPTKPSPSWEGGENFVNGASVKPGDSLAFAFVVHNYGTEDLQHVYISFPDQRHGAVPFLAISAHHDVTCPTSTLAAGSSMTCTANTKVISYGSQYLNVEVTALGACDGVIKYRAAATGRWFSVKPQFANGGEGEAEGGRSHHGGGKGEGKGEGRGEGHGEGGSTPPPSTNPPNPIPPNAGSGGCDALWWIANAASYPTQWNQWTKYYVAAGLSADPLAEQTLSKVLRADDSGLNPFYRHSAVALLNAATNPDFGVSLAIVQSNINAALTAYFVQGDDTLVNQYLPLFASWSHPC